MFFVFLLPDYVALIRHQTEGKETRVTRSESDCTCVREFKRKCEKLKKEDAVSDHHLLMEKVKLK